MFNIANFLLEFIRDDKRFYYLSLIKESEYSEVPWSIHGLGHNMTLTIIPLL